MLGKIFERMLEVKERKSRGAFYTPREIVHYMAQQSLLYYLLNSPLPEGWQTQSDGVLNSPLSEGWQTKSDGVLPEITDKMSNTEKQKIIDKVFATLYDKNHPVRKNLYFMDSVEEVKIIKESLKK